ncbi:MAG: DUF721 domain-containing protein [Bacteroidetes bacterium]|nr:DUF721 domain-containing protein [Bacteroidota bacterium]
MDSIKTINNILGSVFVNQNKIKAYEAYLKNQWNDMMPHAIKIRTKSIKLSNKTLIIKLDSSPLKQELQIMETKIINKLNQHDNPLNYKYIEKLIFL